MSLFSSFIFPSNPFLSGIDKSALGLEFQLDQNLHTFSAFHFTVYCTEQFCRHPSPFQNSDTLLYTSMVNLVRIQQSLRSTETSPFFLYQFLFLSHMFFSFCSEVPQSFGSPPKFHLFQPTCCHFLSWTRMCAWKKSIGKASYLAWGINMRGKKRQSAQTIYWLPDISPFQNDLSVRQYIACFI